MIEDECRKTFVTADRKPSFDHARQEHPAMIDLSRQDPRRFGRPWAGCAVATFAIALLSSCTTTTSPSAQAAISDERLGDICDGQLSFDVTGPYFASCRNYLRDHSVASVAVPHTPSVPAEHRACQEIGLAENSTAYKSCVQNLYQLDVSAAHL